MLAEAEAGLFADASAFAELLQQVRHSERVLDDAHCGAEVIPCFGFPHLDAFDVISEWCRLERRRDVGHGGAARRAPAKRSRSTAFGGLAQREGGGFRLPPSRLASRG